MLKNYVVWKNRLENLLNRANKTVSVINVINGYKYVYTLVERFILILDVYILVGNNLNNI